MTYLYRCVGPLLNAPFPQLNTFFLWKSTLNFNEQLVNNRRGTWLIFCQKNGVAPEALFTKIENMFPRSSARRQDLKNVLLRSNLVAIYLQEIIKPAFLPRQE